MFKYHKGILPILFHDMFKCNLCFHDYSTRERYSLRMPLARLTVRTHSIRFTGENEWNSISPDLESSTTLSRFRTLFKQHTFKKLLSMSE